MYRFNPALANEGKNPLQLDYKEPSIPVKDFAYNETRFRMLVQANEERAQMLLEESQQDVKAVWKRYSQMAAMDYSKSQS